MTNANWAALTQHVLARLQAALSRAHGAGYVHGDIQPSNVVVVQTAEWARPDVYLIDWGVSNATEESSARTRWFGVPAFASDARLRQLDEHRRGRIATIPPVAVADDIAALAYTCSALELARSVHAPWADSFGFTVEAYIADRRAFLDERLAALPCGPVSDFIRAAGVLSTVDVGCEM